MSADGSSDAGFTVVTSDTVDFTGGKIRRLYVGGTGDVVAIVGGTALTFKAVPVGTVLPIGATRINATSTTATLMIGMY